MEDDEPQHDPGDEQQNRLAMGIALGTPFGVLLSLLLDNWGMLGVGVALGVAYGAIPVTSGRAAQERRSSDEEDSGPG
jgi:hypothetical protein